MGSNTLTQLSDQTNWVWDYVYVSVCRRTLVYVCLNACVTLSWTILSYQYCLFSVTALSPLNLLKCGCKKIVIVYVRLFACVVSLHASVMTAYVTQTTTSLCACLTFTPICLLKFINFSPARRKKKNVTYSGFLWKLLAEDHAHLQPSDPVSVLTTTTVKMLRDVTHYTQKHKTFSTSSVSPVQIIQYEI